MSTPDIGAEEARREINRLYWESSETVEQLLATLGIGRRALYAALRPVPAGSSCPTCGERLVFSNRTHRALGRALCSGCGAEVAVQADAPGAADPVGEAARPEPLPVEPAPSARARPRARLSAVPPRRVAAVAASAALGVALGVLVARRVRR